MVVFPNAKINLGLNIVAKRADGYHDIVTCFYPIGWSDILEILPADKFQFNSSGENIPGNQADNLCIKAYELLKKEFNLPSVSMHLHKVVPMGAGLGGGSSDAASVLRMLNEIFSLSLSAQQLSVYASQLGSDCSFFLKNKPTVGRGRGNELSEISIPQLKGKFLVVVKPDIHVSTAEAYSNVKPSEPHRDLSELLTTLPVEKWRDDVKNNFEDSVFKKYPAIASVKEELYKSGALYASMSGSGAAVYGVFSDEVDLHGKFNGMKYWSRLIA